MADPESDGSGNQRLDLWLWAARFFKTRSLAAKAVTAGRIRVNGQPAKPARAISVGDQLDIVTPAGRFVVQVVALNRQRRPAAEARALYRESTESIEARERAAEERRRGRAAVVFDKGRPDRRQRRAYLRFHREID